MRSLSNPARMHRRSNAGVVFPRPARQSATSPSGGSPATPPDVIPLLGVAGHHRGGSPRDLAGALRCVHAAGVRRGFLLLAATSLAHDVAGSPSPERDVIWWVRLCREIRCLTRLQIGLVDTPGGPDVASLAERVPSRVRIIPDLVSGERACVIELSRGVCTGDPDLLAQAGALGVPAYAPADLDTAVRDGTIGEFLTRPFAGVLQTFA